MHRASVEQWGARQSRKDRGWAGAPLRTRLCATEPRALGAGNWPRGDFYASEPSKLHTPTVSPASALRTGADAAPRVWRPLAASPDPAGQATRAPPTGLRRMFRVPPRAHSQPWSCTPALLEAEGPGRCARRPSTCSPAHTGPPEPPADQPQPGDREGGAHRGAVVVAEHLLVEVMEEFLFQLKHHLKRGRGRQGRRNGRGAPPTPQGPRPRARLPSGRCRTRGISASRPRWCRRPVLSASWPVCRESGRDTGGAQSPDRNPQPTAPRKQAACLSPCPVLSGLLPPGSTRPRKGTRDLPHGSRSAPGAQAHAPNSLPTSAPPRCPLPPAGWALTLEGPLEASLKLA